jgi:hypothetical protein
MSPRVPLPHPDKTPRDASRGQAHPTDNNESGRRHGNAASTGADDSARNAVHGARKDFGLRLSPEQSSAQHSAAPSWAPRARTVEELRARLQERAGGQSRSMPGYPVDRLGRRLTDFDLDEQEERQRMPEPIPVAWQSPIMPRSPSALSRHVGSGLLGLALGLAITVPSVLWYKGRFDPMALAGLTAADLGLAIAAPSGTAAVKAQEPAVDVRRAVVAVVPSAAPGDTLESTPSVSTPPKATPPPIVAPREEPAVPPVAVLKPAPVEVVAPVAPQPPPVKPEVAMLEDARRLIGEGDFPAARRVLEDRLLATTPAARFLLAETYDPNFLAARGIRSVRAEVPKAIELYREALNGGIDAARQRLTALRP